MLETNRLKIIALSHQQLSDYIVPDQLEQSLGLVKNNRLVSEKIAIKIKERILPKIAIENPDAIFYTFWIIILKSENAMVAEFCFKGPPNENSEVEIGYATYTEYQNQGIMTEALQAITVWILGHTAVGAILAETAPDNYSSHRTLEKSAFRKQEEQPDNWIWKLEKRS